MVQRPTLPRREAASRARQESDMAFSESRAPWKQSPAREAELGVGDPRFALLLQGPRDRIMRVPTSS
eukprot:3262055-Alexandrium_andersonii.AAC.1